MTFVFLERGTVVITAGLNLIIVGILRSYEAEGL